MWGFAQLEKPIASRTQSERNSVNKGDQIKATS